MVQNLDTKVSSEIELVNKNIDLIKMDAEQSKLALNY